MNYSKMPIYLEKIKGDAQLLNAKCYGLFLFKKITRGSHLLDPRWNGLFLIICQNDCFLPPQESKLCTNNITSAH